MGQSLARYSLGCLFLLGCSAEPNSFPASYSGWNIETEWAFHFRDNGTLTLELNGHIAVDTTEGTYFRSGDTLWLNFTDSFYQISFERDFFLLSGDTALVDFRAGYSFTKEGFSTNVIPVAYPETYPYVVEGSLEEKIEVGCILKELFQAEELAGFLDEKTDSIPITGWSVDLLDPIQYLNDSLQEESLSFRWDRLMTILEKIPFLRINAFKIDEKNTWVWLDLYENEKLTHLLAHFRKHNGHWEKVAIR